MIAPFSEILCHVEASHLTLNENQLTGFSMMQVFTERWLRVDFHFSLNVNVDVTAVSYINSNSSEIKLNNFLQQWINLIISRTMKPESTKLPFLKQIHRSCFFIFLFYVFLKHKHDMRLTYFLIIFLFLQIHLFFSFLNHFFPLINNIQK